MLPEEKGRRKGKMGKGGQLYGDGWKETKLLVVSTV